MTNTPPTIRPDDIPELIFIPAGPFLMGSEINDLAAHDNEKPRHEVRLEDFKIGRYPVTNAQYAAFIKETGKLHPSPWEDKFPPTHLLDHPVVKISYIEAEAYCHWLAQVTGKPFRLPTEYEWEKAARGALSNDRQYTWATGETENRCNTKEAGIGGPTPVTRYEHTSASPFDVVDMLGNVWEWTENWYGRYDTSEHESVNYGRTYKVVRGGSWSNPLSRARISCRGRYKPGVKRPYLGFRVAAEIITKYDNPNYLNEIVYPIINQYFNKEEIRDMCFQLGIEYEEFPTETRTAMSRELIRTCDRLGNIDKLVKLCQQKRPNIIWPKGGVTNG